MTPWSAPFAAKGIDWLINLKRCLVVCLVTFAALPIRQRCGQLILKAPHGPAIC